MQQLTVRGFDQELERRIRDLAKRTGISLNQAVLRLLRKGAGLEPQGGDPRVIGDGLNDLIGTWNDDEAAEFERVVADFSHIDEDMWR